MSSRADKDKKRAKLEELKAARAGGKRDYKPQEDSAIYDEVDESDYKVIVKGRLQEDDFIEEDNGVSGYADNGMEDWDRSEGSSDEEEKEARKRAKKAKASTSKAAAKPSDSSKSLTSAAARRKAQRPVIEEGANPYVNPNRKKEVKMGAPLPQQEDDFMANLLGGLEGQATISKQETFKPASARQSIGSSNALGKRRIGDHGAVRSMEASSSDAAVSSDPFFAGKESGVSSDGEITGMGSAKKARVEEVEQDLGGMGDMDFGDYGGSWAEDEDVKMDGAKLEEDDDDEVFVKPDLPVKAKGPPVRRQLVNGAAVRVVPKPEPVDFQIPAPHPLPIGNAPVKPKVMDWRTATAALAAVATPAGAELEEEEEEKAEPLPLPESLKRGGKKAPPPPKVPHENVNALEEDGSLRFWWFDYVEAVPGELSLIGKVRVKGGANDGKWVSACVTVTGIRRKLYVLPRAKALDSDGVEIDDDDEPPEFDDVEMDFVTDATERYGATNVVCTPDWVKRRYVFDIKGIPREESDWLEVTCDFPNGNMKGDRADIPADASGERYSHVFGTNTSGFEFFVLARKIMGPCWLNIPAPRLSTKDVSWTKLQVEVAYDEISTFAMDDKTAPKDAPPLTIMSISSRTVLHLSQNKRELVCVSMRTWQDSNLDDPLPIEKQPSSVTTLVRSLHGPFPNGFEAAARAAKPKGRGSTLLPLRDEKALLTQLVNTIARNDPDVIVGHDFLSKGAELDILLERLKEFQVDNWSKIGRFYRPKIPLLRSGANAGLIPGRLVCDLSSDGSKSIIDSVTWSLTEMCGTHLKIEREDLDPEDTALLFDQTHSTPAKLLHFVLHCEADAFFLMAIAFKVQALPLTRQLTNLAGNSWNKTLAGNRAERNEYILLHRFNENGFVCPDKFNFFERKAAEAKALRIKAKGKAKDDKDDTEVIVAKKEKFKGGHVMEPTRGLWDRYVLVMDFNSLYPSIIQEYDIDFSTIEWTADGAEDPETMPDRAPIEGAPQGILPQLIASLVDRRRAVKRMMKDKSVSPATMAQYDIRQKALKLTANSMYGCLGYEGSRFYARALASLTTFKGRVILMRTKADAEGLGLQVIYGDTDSVMINTNVLDYQEALRIGEDFKKLINEKYRKLEIDTDAVFKPMLLLNKKKYAAVRIEEDGSTSTEVKGLDMKRREFCELSKATSKYVLDRILSGEATEIVVEEIHEYLTNLGENVRAGSVPIEQYIIFKRLGKDPEKYPDAKSLPHVQVALKMKSKGQAAKEGDVVPYIFCIGDHGSTGKTGKAENAHHPDDVRRQGSTLKIDFEVYLSGQILPAIERLCEHIEGTEKARLAECLGLDVTHYKNSTGEVAEREFKTLQSQITDKERFADSEPLSIRCRSCHSEAIFDGAVENVAGLLTPSGIFCANAECSQPLSYASMAVQLDLACRSFITKFYEQWLVCNDSSCGHRTRMMSVYGKRCLATPCRGQMHFEYSDSKLYNQLLFFDSLFDPEKGRTSTAGTAKQAEVVALLEANKGTFTALRAVIQKHLDKNGRRWVGMAALFSYMGSK